MQTSKSTDMSLGTGAMIALGIIISKELVKLELAPKPVEFAFGWFLASMLCYLLPKRFNSPSITFAKWLVMSLVIALIAFVIELVLPESLK